VIRAALERDFERFKQGLPADFPQYVLDAYRIDLTARYLDYTLAHPIGKGSGQLSLNTAQLEDDRAARLAYVVLKTVIAEDSTGAQSMSAWAIHETRMQLDQRRAPDGRSAWNVTWKGRGWDRSLDDYLALVRAGRDITTRTGMPVIPSVKYHLPKLNEQFRESEYRFTTERIVQAWGAPPLGLEIDFSPTLAGDSLADDRAQILRWLREIPGRVSAASPVPTVLSVKLMNARFDDAFQLEMMDACTECDTLVCFNRLFDPNRGVAFGGWELSDRNLRVLGQFTGAGQRRLAGTGNIHTGRLIADYARVGCQSVQLHTFFQLPLSEYPATHGSRTERALHLLLFHPQHGLLAALLDEADAGRLEPRSGVLHFLDLSSHAGRAHRAV